MMWRLFSAAVVVSSVVMASPMQVGETACEVTIMASSLRVRTGPSEAYEPIGAVSEGQTLEVIAVAEDVLWGRIQFVGEVGWLSLDPAFVDLPENCDVPSVSTDDIPAPPDGERLLALTIVATSDLPTTAPPTSAATVTLPPSTEAPAQAAEVPAVDTPVPTRTPQAVAGVQADDPAQPNDEPPETQPTVSTPWLPIVGAALLLVGLGGFIWAAGRRDDAQPKSASPPPAPVEPVNPRKSASAVPPVEQSPAPANPPPHTPAPWQPLPGPERRMPAQPPDPEPAIAEVPTDATPDALLGPAAGDAPTTAPSLQADLRMLARLYMAARPHPNKYAPVSVMVAQAQRNDVPLTPHTIMDAALRLRKVYPHWVAVGEYEQGGYGIRLDEALIRGRFEMADGEDLDEDDDYDYDDEQGV